MDKAAEHHEAEIDLLTIIKKLRIYEKALLGLITPK